jgi:hypothetical protein
LLYENESFPLLKLANVFGNKRATVNGLVTYQSW